MEHVTVLDEFIQLETANAVKDYCNDSDLTLDEFLRGAISAMSLSSTKASEMKLERYLLDLIEHIIKKEKEGAGSAIELQTIALTAENLIKLWNLENNY